MDRSKEGGEGTKGKEEGGKIREGRELVERCFIIHCSVK